MTVAEQLYGMTETHPFGLHHPIDDITAGLASSLDALFLAVAEKVVVAVGIGQARHTRICSFVARLSGAGVCASMAITLHVTDLSAVAE